MKDISSTYELQILLTVDAGVFGALGLGVPGTGILPQDVYLH